MFRAYPFDHSMAAYLAGQGRRVRIVFETTDSFVASAKPLPDYIRRGRYVQVCEENLLIAL